MSAAPARVWAPWPTWDAELGGPGPLHGPRRDRPDGGKDIPWPPGAEPKRLAYFATADHRPPAPGALLVLTEGEKAADAAAEAGYSAAATVCGAPSDPEDAVVRLLAAYRVVLSPDNDPQGIKHMQRLSERLERAGVAGLFWLEPPEGAPEHWDLADAERGRRVEIVASARRLDLFAPSELEELDAALGALEGLPGDGPPGDDPPGTGVRPMSEVESQPPPPPLVREFLALHPGEGAILYGPGGSGKGTTAAWLALEHVRQDPEGCVYVADFERHEAEWGGRLRRLGAAAGELARIHYASPYSPLWTAPRGLLPEVAHLVRADCDRLGVSLLVVDSITVAAAAGDAMGGQQSASEYFDALARIGRRSLSLAHVTGAAQRWPDRPFGSVHLHNLARETWAIEVVRQEAEPPDTRGLTLTAVELRNKKANGRPKARPQVLAFEYEPDYGPITVKAEERQAGHGDLVHDALRKSGEDAWLTAKQLAAAVLEDAGERVTEAQVYDAIRRDRRSRFRVDETRRPRRFAVKP